MRDRAIWKTLCYPDVGEVCEVEVPTGAKPISVQREAGSNVIAVWWIVEYEQPLVKKIVDFIGTGWKFDLALQGEYVGTIQDRFASPALVWHVFVR